MTARRALLLWPLVCTGGNGSGGVRPGAGGGADLLAVPVGMVSGLQQLFTLICLFYIGSIIAEPARETLSASLADARARGSYMGFSRLGLAIGGAIGYIGGGWLFDLGKSAHQPELPWMMLGIIGIFTFLALGWQFSQKRAARRLLERDA